MIVHERVSIQEKYTNLGGTAEGLGFCPSIAGAGAFFVLIK